VSTQSFQKPATHNADLAHLPAALLPLTEQARWVVWPWELRTTKGGKSKWTKPPRQARDPARNARSNDSGTWGSYSDAVAAVTAGNADGIGYMLLDSGIGAIDCDHCVDRAIAKLDTWAEQLHDEARGAYQEITVSGGGLRIIGTVAGPRRIENSPSTARLAPVLNCIATRRGTSRFQASSSAGRAPNCHRSIGSSIRWSGAIVARRGWASTSTTPVHNPRRSIMTR
jgi:hypothetical protein